MSLKDRLTRLTGDGAKPRASDARQERISELRRTLDRFMDRRAQGTPPRPQVIRRHAVPLEHVVAGEETRTAYGNFFVSRTTVKADEVHGHARICDVAGASIEAACFLAGLPMAQGLLMSGALFLDTETTGLAGGTGTFPFLVGLGWFETNSFVTCQLFARDFSEEAPMLRYLSEIASGKQFLVSFNGKAYDLNLLAARFILNRCRDTLTALPHVDLLHPCRRILAHRLENARLSTIEMQVLGVERNGDVPGFEIPQRYFDWLRSRDGTLLEDVFTHNRLDIVSMASLLKYLSDLVKDGQVMGHLHHGDLLRLAELIHERGEVERAGRMLETLLSSHDSAVVTRAGQSLSLIYKKSGRWEEAARLWNGLVASDPHNFFAVEELAKYYEHRTRECGKAVHIVRTLLDEAGYLDDVQRASAEYRLRRLLHKVSAD